MAVDINIIGVVGQEGLVLEDDHLIILQSRSNTSRIWRIPYEQVTQIIVTRRRPWVRMILMSMLPAMPGLLFLGLGIGALSDGNSTAIALLLLAGVFALLLLIILAWYEWCRKTVVDIHYGSRHRKLEFIVRPKKRERFLDRMIHDVQALQARKWEAYHAAQPSQVTEEPTESPSLQQPTLGDVTQGSTTA